MLVPVFPKDSALAANTVYFGGTAGVLLSLLGTSAGLAYTYALGRALFFFSRFEKISLYRDTFWPFAVVIGAALPLGITNAMGDITGLIKFSFARFMLAALPGQILFTIWM